MTDECPKCKREIPITMEPSRSGAREFSAKCPYCCEEYGGFIVSTPPDPPKPEKKD